MCKFSVDSYPCAPKMLTVGRLDTYIYIFMYYNHHIYIYIYGYDSPFFLPQNHRWCSPWNTSQKIKHGLTDSRLYMYRNNYLDIPGYFQVIPQKNKHFTQYDIHLMEYIGYNVICIYIYSIVWDNMVCSNIVWHNI